MRSSARSAMVGPILAALTSLGCGDVVVDLATGNSAASSGRTSASGTGAGTTSGSSSAGSSSGGGAGGSATSGSGTGGATNYRALVTTHPDPMGPCFMDGWLNPPDPVFLLVASGDISCALPSPAGLTATACSAVPFVWELCVAIPANKLSPSSYELDTFAYNAETVVTVDCNGGCCGEGVLLPGEIGTFGIADVGATTVQFALAGTELTTYGGRLVASDGAYTAVRCP